MGPCVRTDDANERREQTIRPINPARICASCPIARIGTPGIQLSGVSKTYRSRDGDVPSLRPLDFHINAGEFFVVVGPSGCGKSTLLKMISGLLPPSTGEIFVEGEKVDKPHGNVGIVFQNSLLLPWRNILNNVMLPIDMKRLSARGISAAGEGAAETGRARRL